MAIAKVSLNIHQIVQIELYTPGVRVYNDYVDSCNGDSGALKVTPGKTLTMALWEVMAIFGPHMRAGVADQFFSLGKFDINIPS